MISEGLYDTENWSNDAENSDLPLKYITTEKLFKTPGVWHYSRPEC